MRVHLKGLNWATKRLANGESRTYYYAWPGGPRIDAVPGTPEFVRLFNEAHAARRQPPAGLFMRLIAEFKGSAEFTRLAPSSSRAYSSYLALIEDNFGDMPIEALSDPRVRGSSRRGVTGSLRRRERRTLHGRSLPGFCRLPRIAVPSRSIHANAAAGCTRPIERTSSGARHKLPPSSLWRAPRCNWRPRLLYGPGNARAISYGFPGLPMMESTSDSGSRRQAAVLWCRLAVRSELCSTEPPAKAR